MKILTRDEIRAVETRAFEKYFTEAQLMLRAGEACFDKIIKYYGKQLPASRVAVLCGNGKNAGDGFVLARLLCTYGADAFIVLTDKEPVLPEPCQYFEEALSAGVQIYHFHEAELQADFIVDCIFGIGFHGTPRAPFDAVFDAVNTSGATVIAIDTPSGTDATTGEAVQAVRADLTIAISTLKYAHVLPPANSCCGKTVVAQIGIPEDCYTGPYVQTISKTEVKHAFPRPDKNANKGTFGHLLSICGSYRMPGAAVFCAKGALRTGVGLVKCVFPKSAYPFLAAHLTQPIFEPVTENEEKTLSMGALTGILEELPWADAVVIGCGLGVNDDTSVIVSQILRECKKSILIDADGINCLCENINLLQDINIPVVLTPHPGEMARLTGRTVSEVQNDRIGIAKDFASRYGVVVVLKGANTVVTDGKTVLVNTNGNNGMAMGGSGDLLSGMIASFLAQGMDALSAAKAGVFIHGLCGDLTAGELSKRGMTVEDMADLLGALMSEFE